MHTTKILKGQSRQDLQERLATPKCDAPEDEVPRIRKGRRLRLLWGRNDRAFDSRDISPQLDSDSTQPSGLSELYEPVSRSPSNSRHHEAVQWYRPEVDRNDYR